MATTRNFVRSTSKLQSWSPELYDTNARFVGDLAVRVLELLDMRPGERILDIGCGDGYLTQRMVDAGANVVGLDFSPELVNAARARGIDVRLGNAEELNFESEFDGVFSNAALHWMRRADALVNGVMRALRPGGRFVGEFAGARNARLIRAAIHEGLDKRGINSEEVDPWYLPEEHEYREVLEQSGFHVTLIELFDRPVIINYPISDWIQTFGSPYLVVLPYEDRAPFLAHITEVLRPQLLGRDGRWTVDYTRLRFRAEKC